jgi:hypothetical protein
MHTEKDAEIVDWLRIGAAGAEHVMERSAMGRSWAHARPGKLPAGGLLGAEDAPLPAPGPEIPTLPTKSA